MKSIRYKLIWILLCKMANSRNIYHSKSTWFHICGKYQTTDNQVMLRTEISKLTCLIHNTFTMETVNTDAVKTSITALVHIGVWIYFCYRKLIETDALVFTFSRPSNVQYRPESSLSMILWKTTTTLILQSTFFFLYIFSPVFKSSIRQNPLYPKY